MVFDKQDQIAASQISHNADEVSYQPWRELQGKRPSPLASEYEHATLPYCRRTVDAD